MEIPMIQRATQVKARMTQHCLSSQWLILRLFRDHGIDVDKATVSRIMSGERLSGGRVEQVISASEAILDAYEAYYAGVEGA